MMLRGKKDERVGQRWKRGILAIIFLSGAFFVTMIAVHPFGSSPWLWAFALTVYMPFVLVGAGVLKFLILLGKRALRL
jgi:hypothetical protein